MKVPYSYLPQQFSEQNCEQIWQEMKKVILEGDFTLGKRVEEFEHRFADFIGTKYAVGVGSGTGALFLSLKALNIGNIGNNKKNQEADEVITAANTFIATAGAIATSGARPVFVDCNEKYVIDVNKIERAINEHTRAIMPVHYSGQPAAMKKINEIARRYHLHVIEDACCAIDAEVDGGRCGTFGDSAAFSMHPLKNLNVWGDGGIITTNSEEIRDKLILLRNHGMRDRDHYAFFGYNCRLDSIQSVVGNYLLKDVKWITNKRIEYATRIDAGLAEISEVTIPPRSSKTERRVYHMYMLLVRDRDQLFQHLLQKGVDAKIHYPIPLHLQEASRYLEYSEGNFPVAEAQAKSIISLPVHQHLTIEQIDYTIACVREFYAKK